MTLFSLEERSGQFTSSLLTSCESKGSKIVSVFHLKHKGVTNMASNTQKTKRRRNAKKKPNKSNLKADMKRTDRTRKILRELGAKENL